MTAHEAAEGVYTALERFPSSEMALRHARARALMDRLLPRVSGLLVFSRVSIYYLTGTLANGVFWLPREGGGALLTRKGAARARLESPVECVAPYRSFKDLPGLLAESGHAMGPVVAVDSGALSWDMGLMLKERVPGVEFVSGDALLQQARAVKTEWELAKLREAGARHRLCLRELLPAVLRPGMTERDIALRSIVICLEQGHAGPARLNAPGEEMFFGHVAAADSGNYPTYYNGPMGFRGVHPAQPCMGGDTVWRPGTPLCVDTGFSHQGYITDKTQCYWAGSRQSLSDDYARAYDACLAVHERASAALKPGALPRDIWQEALEYVAGTPYARGFMGLDENHMPFLGHGIGLAVDERPVIAHGFSQPLQAGMVIALEPKIGLPGKGMVGIENTFEITDTGCRNLTDRENGMIFID